MKIICVFILAVAATQAVPQSVVHEKWAEFKITNKKQYSSPAQELNRLVIFTANSAKIEAHNVRYNKGEVTYYKGMNKFGDLTEEEFLAFVNRDKSKKIDIPAKFRKPYIPTKVPLDADVDWRTQGAVSDVKTEGDCGSSWSFSATGAVEGQLAIKNGQLISLSAQNLIDCSADYGNAACDGGLIDSAFDYIHENGIMAESDYPYEGALGTCRFDPSRSVVQISGYQDIQFMSEADLANAVASVGPIAASVDATAELQFYYGGIFFDDTCNINLSDLNQGVLVVGYGTELQYDYWIVKNSWGTDWGENGFYQSIRNYGNNCGIATSASYPIL